MPHPGLANQHRLSACSARRIAAVYGLGEIISFEPIAAGYLNQNYVVETGRGRYFLKHHVGMRQSDLRQQHRMLGALQAAGLPVAAPLADTHGQTFLTVDRRPLAIFPWVEGEHRPGNTLTDADCFEIGALLGRTHRALAETGNVAQQTFMLPPVRPDRTLARAFDLRHRVQAHQPPDPFDALAEECLDFTIDQVQGAEHATGLQPCLTTWQWTHGDFYSGNVLFGPDGTMTIIDWDRTRVQSRLFELIRAIVLWLAEQDTGRIDLQKVWSMMRGYASWVPVEPGVISEIVDYFWWSKLNDLWILDRHYLQADPIADDLLPTTLGWLRWLLAHRRTLAQALDDDAHVDISPSCTRQ